MHKTTVWSLTSGHKDQAVDASAHTNYLFLWFLKSEPASGGQTDKYTGRKVAVNTLRLFFFDQGDPGETTTPDLERRPASGRHLQRGVLDPGPVNADRALADQPQGLG